MNDRTSQARRYQSVKLWFHFATLIETAALLVWFQLSGLSERLAVFAESSEAPRALQILIYASVFHLVTQAIFLPQQYVRSFVIEKRFGLSNERFGGWLADEAKSFALGWIVLGATSAAFYLTAAAQPENWWWIVGLLYSAATLFVAHVLPTWIVPLFFPMKPLPAGPLKERIARAAEKIGVPIRDVYEIALSRKTHKANAAVLGLGKTKRIVLGDTLINAFTPEEIEFVLAHELGHHKLNHLRYGLAFGFALGMGGFWALYAVWPKLEAMHGGLPVGDLAAYPALLLMMTLFRFVTGPLQNAFSRKLERDADAFGLRFTRDRGPFVSSMQKLADKNLADPDPNPLVEFFFYSHPAISRRIRYAREAKI